jgi:hypothetical protein
MKTPDSNLKYIRAKNKVEKVKGFYYHVAVYIIVNLVLTGFKVSNNLESWASFSNELLSINVLSSWTIWGIFLVLHLLSFTYGQGWEERKIEELMNKELSKNSKEK